MKTLELLIISIVLQVSAALVFLFLLIRSRKKTKDLEDSNNSLIKDLKAYSRHGIPLEDIERVLIWKAITSPQFKDSMKNPITPRLIREAYKELKKKMKDGDKGKGILK